MKLLPSWILVCSSLAFVVACAPEPSVPLPAATSAAPKAPAPPKNAKAQAGRTSQRTEHDAEVGAASVLPLEPNRTKSAPRAPKARTAVTADDLRDAESRGMLRWLPSDALVVLRVPHVELLGELSSRSSMAALLQGPLAASALAGPGSPIGMLEQELRAEAPELERLIELWPTLHGELVLGVTHFAPDLKARSPSFTVASAFAVEGDADTLQEVLDAYFGRLQRTGAHGVKPLEVQWGYRGVLEAGRFEITREGSVFAASYSTESEDKARAGSPASRPIAQSFAATSLVLASPDLNAEGQGVVELYIHAAPVWDMVRALAPAAAQDVLQGLGLYDIEGTSFALALGEKGLDEALTWCSPAHGDIVSRTFAGRPANRELGRWIPSDATTAGLYAFDLSALFDAVADAMPEKEAQAMAKDLAGLKAQTGIDFAKDVVENFGPSLAIVSRGDPLALMNGFSGMCFAIETHDAVKTKRVLDVILATLPPELRAKPARVAGQDIQSIDLRAMGAPLAAISWCQVEGALLVATDNKMLERCLVAGRTEGVKQPDLAAALAGEGVIGAGLSAAVGDLPKTLSVLRKTGSGFQISSVDGSGAMGGSSLAALPILASVAIPNLLSARTAANESAAIATLRNICSAEAQFQATGALDLDQDGVGEYGFFGELAGMVPLRGSKSVLEPPLLSRAMGQTQNGMLARSGYLFQVWLPAADGEGAVCDAEMPGRASVSVDLSEGHFTAYAWPMEAGAASTRVFCLRDDIIYECQDARRAYAGPEHAPAFDAGWPAKAGANSANAKPYVGRDGLTWKLLD